MCAWYILVYSRLFYWRLSLKNKDPPEVAGNIVNNIVMV